MLVKVAIDLALDRLFTYEVPEHLTGKLAVGQLLSVPFGRRAGRGFAMELCESCGGEDIGFKIKQVEDVVDEVPFFSPALISLASKVAAYTVSPLESVLKAALPAAVMKKNARPRELLFVDPLVPPKQPPATKRQEWLYQQIVRLDGGWMSQLCRELKTTPSTLKELCAKGLASVSVKEKRRNPMSMKRILPSKPLPLNEFQASALSVVCSSTKPVLLHGITGSGKTEVYLQAIAAELSAGRGAIVMVPEISLTPQTVQRFASRFGEQVAVLHSGLSDGERYDEWHRIRSGKANVVVGPRSAVWAPVERLGLIVVDEEHDSSYKQDDTPRYNARDVAVLRGSIENAKVVLGSATPSLESWMNVRTGKYVCASIPVRAGSGALPDVKIVEMFDSSIFSRELLDAISARIDRGEQTILFLNRRGYSRSMVCGECGHVLECPECSMPYTYHKADNCLRCHICGEWIEVPAECPQCRNRTLSCKGIGTQRVEAALAKCFPRARVLRMDADSTGRRHSHDDILSSFGRGEADILVGTQMIAKGLDFPNVTLVGVLNADSSLNVPDFRAAERTYQLISQVAGRAGRSVLPGEVVIQTHDACAPAILSAARGDFAAFAEDELKSREEGGFPPFCRFALVKLKSKDLKSVADWADMYSKSLQAVAGLTVGEAMPSALEKADGFHRWQIWVRSPSAAAIARAWRWLATSRPPPSNLRVSIDIDAINLL